MKQLHTLRYLALFLMVLLLTPLIACSAPASPTSTTGTPVKGGSVTVGITQEPLSLDPFVAQAAGDKEILFNVYEGLLKPDASGEMQFALAEDYEISEDATLYTFSIRPDVRFHNGQTMTIEDVAYSLRRAAGLDGSEPRTGLSGVSEVEVIDESTVVLHLNEPDIELIPFLITAIVPDGAVDLAAGPVGTGPFRIDSYTTGQDVVLMKNDQYWKPGFPLLDKVIFKITADMDSAFLELKAGNLDIFPYLSFEREDEIKALYDTREDLKNMVQILALNNDRPPFDDVRVRRAVNLAVDRQNLLDQLNAGYGTTLTTGMSPAMGPYYNEDLDGQFDRNLDEARTLLEEAGYADGFTTTVTVPSNYILHVNTAVILAQQLKEVGIDMEIQQVDWATWLEQVYFNRDHDSTIIALTSEFTPKDILARYGSDNSGNFINFSNTEYDQVLSETLSSLNEDARIEGYHRLQEILVEDAASVFLQDPVTMVAVHRSIGGYEVYPVYVQDLSTVYRTN